MDTTNSNLSTNGSGHNGYGSPPWANKEEEPSKKLTIQNLFYLLWAGKWIILAFVAACVGLAWFSAALQTPVYQSRGSLMIKKSRNQYSYASSDLGNLLTNSYGIGIGNSITDELQILQSRRLSKAVADTLSALRLTKNGRQYPVLFTRYPVDSTLASRAIVAYRLRQNLSFQQFSQLSNLINISYESVSPVAAASIVNITMDAYSRLSTRQNRKSASSAVKFLNDEKHRVQHKLNGAENILEQYMNKHKLVKVNEQTNLLIDRTADLEKRRQEAQTKLVAVNSGLTQYQQQLNNIKPGLADQFSNAIGPSMERLQYQLAEFKTERMKLLSENPQLENSSDPPKALRKLNRQIKEYKDEIRKQTRDVLSKGDQYLSMLGSESGSIAENVSNLQQRLISLKVKQQQYQSQNSVLTKQINKLNKTFDSLPENMISLARLKRKVQINKELYETVSKQQARMQLWKQTRFGKGQLIDKGFVPAEPLKPNTLLYLLVGFVLGGITGVSFLFTREAFNNAIDGTQKLKSLHEPILSVVPDLQSFTDEPKGGQHATSTAGREVSNLLVTRVHSTSLAAEAFRRLESNILHTNPDAHLNSLMVTSATKGEGKTLVTANLAVVMAEAEQKVLVIDTDMRRPSLHRMFGLERSPGIHEILFDNCSLEESIRATSIPNLSVLTAGESPPNPSAVAKSNSFHQLIRNLKKRYDRLLIDTAPFGLITDVSSLIDQMDGIAVVCRFNITKKDALQHTLDQLHQINAPVLGTVLNGFEVDKSSDYYYGQNYYKKFYHDYEAYEKV